MSEKETKFEGYLSGDYECFCLSKVPFEEWVKRKKKMRKIDIDVDGGEKYAKEYDKIRSLLLYPSSFFPKGCDKKKKWKFIITVKAEPMEEEKC